MALSIRQLLESVVLLLLFFAREEANRDDGKNWLLSGFLFVHAMDGMSKTLKKERHTRILFSERTDTYTKYFACFITKYDFAARSMHTRTLLIISCSFTLFSTNCINI